MRPHHPPPSDNDRPGDIETIKTLLPYLWPEGRADLRLRVVVSMVLLGAAKVMTVAVPVILKYTVDALSGEANGVGSANGAGALVAG